MMQIVLVIMFSYYNINIIIITYVRDDASIIILIINKLLFATCQ